MNSTRRSIIKTAGSIATIAGAPAIARAQAAPSPGRTVRAVKHSDIPTFDPIWTTANMSAYHGSMVYDTLFSIDENFNPHPQMVGRYNISDDKLTYTFELRDGLRWSDGTAVTARDCVASIRRWGVRDGAGQLMMARVADLSAKDEKTIVLRMRERWGMVLDALAKTATPICFMMREKEANTDPMQKIDTIVGSGPFIMNERETRVGSQYVYDRNPNYVPRTEAPSGTSGGKVVKLDRVIFVNMPDAQTAVAALQAGEIDFYEVPPIDLIDQLEADRNIRLNTLFKLGQVSFCRLNFLHPPFNNVKARQAVLHVVNQENHMKVTYANSKYYRSCPSFFTCGSPMENDANVGWFNNGRPDIAKARELVKESGYDGRPITLLQGTNIPYMRNSAEILAQELRQIGFNVQMLPMEWSGVVARRAVKAPPDQGGWNIFITGAGGAAVGNPILLVVHQATGEKGWFGWPEDAKHEELRGQWAMADSVEERKKIAREIQANAWNFVPTVYLGQSIQPAAHRANLRGLLPIAEVIPWWNVERV